MAENRRKRRWRPIRRWLGNLLFLLAALALGLALLVRFLDQPAQPSVADKTPVGSGPALVTQVIDGDTIDVTINGTRHRVRYIGIDTPETGEDWWDQATARNRSLVTGKTVQLVQDVSETDRYGRLLRYVYLPDGRLINEVLVQEGLARVTLYPPDTALAERLQAAEQQAKAGRLGRWAADE